MRNDQRGNSAIDVLLLGLIFLAPLIWGLGVLADVHRAALAGTSAAREAGFDAASRPDVRSAEAAISEAVRRAFMDEGLDPDLVRIAWDASSDLDRGSLVEIEVRYPVTVVQAPFLGRVAGPSIWVNSRHVATIDPYRSR